VSPGWPGPEPLHFVRPAGCANCNARASPAGPRPVTLGRQLLFRFCPGFARVLGCLRLAPGGSVSPAASNVTCPGCDRPFAPNPVRRQRFCSESCGRRSRRPPRQPSLGRCSHCNVSFIRPLRAPQARFCSRRCRDRTRSAATKTISHGWARVARSGAGRRDRPLRCPACRGQLGFAASATTLVLEHRVVMQVLDTGQVRLSVECSICSELRLVAAMPPRLPAAASAGQGSRSPGLAAAGHQ
jgi:hypothetical protein